ncbi:rhomboid family intramembrane serine protease [Pedobacter sp. SYSU D00535]|uniref:rhomboid family intramembrane serine protease n=1 Tax=Pedobacter sp. SYSU D00535 TaxID=2810308 RepID=UPI001A966689|nr:rhomboid family intramembrane serine protease [Pedobacter sp. SYSU D00535]
MLFPIGDDNVRGKHKPVFTYLLIILNCYFFWQELQLNEQQLGQLFYTYGAVPSEVTSGRSLHTLFTSMFLHGGWMHLIGNMLFLWIFADNIEISIGNIRFILFYLAGGVFAALVHCLVLPGSTIPCIGASGAIAATLGAYLVMFPSSRIKILFFFFVFRVSAFAFLLFWIAQQLFEGYATLGLQTADTAGIGYWAHIGGFGYGFVRGFFFRSRKKKGKESYDYY